MTGGVFAHIALSMTTESDYFCCSQFERGQFLLDAVADNQDDASHAMHFLLLS